MKKIKINYAIPLGIKCPTAYWLQENGLRRCAYPFDWTRLFTLDLIIKCLTDDFSELLDKSKYVDTKSVRKISNRCGHSTLPRGEDVFWHRDMRVDENYQGLLRNIGRFREVLKKSQPKLFMIGTYHREDFDFELHRETVLRLNETLKMVTENYYILSLAHKKRNYHPGEHKTEIQHCNNVTYVDLFTRGEMGLTRNGKRLRMNSDLDEERRTIFSLFDFSIIDDIGK